MPPGFGSRVASVASQQVSLPGSVKNSNTVSGVARMWISRTIGSPTSTTLLAAAFRSLGLLMVSAPLLLLGLLLPSASSRVSQNSARKDRSSLSPGRVLAGRRVPSRRSTSRPASRNTRRCCEIAGRDTSPNWAAMAPAGSSTLRTERRISHGLLFDDGVQH